MPAAALGVFGEDSQERLLAIERSADLEEVPELIVLRNVVIDEVCSQTGQHASEGKVLQDDLDAAGPEEFHLLADDGVVDRGEIDLRDDQGVAQDGDMRAPLEDLVGGVNDRFFQ